MQIKAFVLLLLGFSFSVVRGQEAGVDSITSLQKLSEITVYSADRSANSVETASATVYVFNKEDIRTRGYQDLKDLLRDIPGIDYTYNYGTPKSTNFKVRGLDGGNSTTVVFKDGIKLNGPQAESMTFGNQLPLFDAERVEIVLTPSSVLFGQDTYAAIISIYTRKDEHVQANSSVGSFGTFAPSFSWNIPLKKGYVFASARAYHSEGYSLSESYPELYESAVDQWKTKIPDWEARFGEEGMQTNARVRDYNFQVEGQHDNLTLGLLHTRVREVKTLSYNPNTYIINHNSPLEYQQTIGYLKHQKQINGNIKTTTMASFAVNQRGWDDGNTYADSSLIDDVTYAPGATKHFYKHNNVFRFEHTLLYQVNSNLYLNIGGLYDHALASPLLESDENIPAQDIPQHVTFYAFSNAGVFLQGRLQMTPKLGLNIGGRLDYNNYYKFDFNPRVALIYQPLPKLTIKSLWGMGYRQPKMEQLFFINETFDRFYSGNPDLTPEKLQAYQLNILASIKQQWKVTSSFFFNHGNKLIESLDMGVNDQGQLVKQPQNINHLDSYGGDFTLQYDPAKFLTLYAWYSFLQVRRKDYTTPELYDFHSTSKISPHKANFALRVQLWKYASLYSSWRFVNHITTRENNTEFEGTPIPGHTQWDLHISSAEVWKEFTLSLGVKNVLNQKIYHSGAGTETGSIRATKMPQPLRQYIVTLGYGF